MQLDLIKEVLTGSITGYITNAIAIKMIFREYGIGKFKLGGVIIKTKDEFINNISSLVERDIINSQTLNSELSKEAFKGSIKDFVNDLLSIHMYKNASNITLEELNGFDSTINNTKELVQSSANKHLNSVFDKMLESISFKDILSEKQIQHISGQLYNCILGVLDSEDFIEKAIKEFYEENKSISFGEFFGQKLLEIISSNVEDNIKNFHIDLKDNFDKDIDKIFENTLETLEVNKILSSLEEKLLEKRIIDFINNKDNINLSKSLIHKIKGFIESNEGKRLINNFSKELHNLLKNIDKSVLELLSDDLKDNFEEFFKDKLQYAVKEIILWIEKNKSDIEGLIEKSIDDTIDSIDDGMKKNILNLVRDKFLNDVANKFDIVSKITEYLENNADIDSISRDVTSIIITYLKEEKVSDIILKLEKNKIFTEESFANFINYNLANYINYIPEDYFCGLLNIKMKDIFSIDLVNIFEKHVKESIISTLKYKYIYTEKVTKTITVEVTKRLKDINNISFEKLISEESLSSNYTNIKKTVIVKMQDNKSTIIDLLSDELKKSIYSLNLYGGLNDELKNTLLDEVVKEVSNKAEKSLENCRDMNLKILCDKINNIEDVNDNLSNSIVLMLKNNLQYILNGNIKKAVSTNLHDLKDEELQSMIEEFMGKEMKPITVIGAMLGAVIGIGMYFFDNSVTQYNYLTATLVSIVVYGFVGWLTNVQALAMLFKPYNEKRLFGIRIPFTPGVIVSRKPKFAKSMSTFVDEELLKKSSMEELFNKNKDAIYNSLKEVISKDNYKIVVDFLDSHSDAISDKAFEYIKNLIERNKSSISDSLTNKAGNFDISNIDFSKLENKLKEKILSKVESSNMEIYDTVEGIFKYNKEISGIIPEQFKESFEKQLAHKVEEEIDKLLSYTDRADKRNELLMMLSYKYENVVNNSVNEMISPENVIKWKSYFGKLISDKVSSKETGTKILNWIESITSKELNPDRKIGELFGGALTNIIESNFSYIMDNTMKAIVSGLSNNRQVISEVAITTTKESLSFFELMGYNMLGGDKIVASVVDDLINDKFPAFIESKKGEINELLGSFIDNKICNGTIENLNIGLQHKEVLEVINNFIDENKVRLNDKIIKITDSMFNWVTDIKLREYLSILSINKIEDIIEIFEEELNFISGELKDNTIEKKQKLIDEYTKLSYNILEELVLSIKVNALAKEIDKEYVEDLSYKICTTISNSNSIRNSIAEFIQKLSDVLKQKKSDELLDLREFNACALNVLEDILQNKKLDAEIRNAVKTIINNIIANDLNIIDASTKDNLSQIVINSILDSASQNFSKVISTIDFRGITEQQINYMEPREIEDLFNSFAKKYFNKLKLYGLWGAVFGIHWIVGLVTCGLYATSAAKEKIKN